MPYGGNFVTRGWAACNGQLLNIAQNQALFALLGTRYGGNGQTTFAVPNLNGRAAIGQGQGAGLSNYTQGAATGTETVTLLPTQLPAHTHDLGAVTVPVSNAAAGANAPTGGVFAKVSGGNAFGAGTGNGPMAAGLLSGNAGAAPSGGGTAHPNLMPYLVLNYFIATQGEFPQRQ